MRPIRATQLWITVSLLSCVVTAFIAHLAHEAWPEVRSVSYAKFAAPGVALAILVVLLIRKALAARAKRALREGLRPD